MIREAFVQAGILKPEVLGEDAFPDAQIVRELAARGPFTRPDEDGCVCAHCGGSSDPDPANHDPSCLWRRSRERYPEAAR